MAEQTVVPVTKARRPVRRRTAPWAQFESTCKRLVLSEADLCEACGYERTSWYDWKKKATIPFVCALACEALVRRQSREAQQYVLAEVSHGQFRVLASLSRLDEALIGGKVYYLIERTEK